MNNFHFSETELVESATDVGGKSASEVWEACLKVIQGQTKPLSYRTWFQPLIAKDIQENLLTVEVPSTYFYEWLEEHYFGLIQASLQNVLGSDAKLQYAVRIPSHIPGNQPTDGNETPTGPPVPTEDGHANGSARNTAGIFEHNLNPKFTFDNYIRGDGNQFARAAALNVAGNPGETAFNPLVLYGGVGLGKTHLIQAIGNSIVGTGNKRVYYVSSEKFTIDFVDSIEKNKTIEFSNFYRNMDVLIVDDIQFFSGKERTQDTFFHTFNTLYQLKKQIVLSSDRPPKELVGLDERLISRFQCGLTVDIQPPDLETRIAILKKKAEDDQFELPQDVIEFIASNVKSNIRELEGCYIGLIARHTLEKRPLDITLAETVLRNVISSERRSLTIEQIQKVVAAHFRISENALRMKSRKQEIVLPRQIAMYLAKNLTKSSLQTVGLHFGGRDHSTIIHANKTIEGLMKDDESLRSHIEQIEKQLSYISN